MKTIVLACVFLFVASSIADPKLNCKQSKIEIPDSWIDMQKPCEDELKRQIQEEMKASLQYMAMGAHFSQDTINRPGFAKHFFEAASEEREHGIKLIEQLLMRGKLDAGVGSLFSYANLAPPTTHWLTGIQALKDALELEAKVTKSIQQVISVCESTNTTGTPFNDYHLVDYLTGVFLEEQYTGQREIAGMISQLEKMKQSHGILGEFLYDKKLLD